MKRYQCIAKNSPINLLKMLNIKTFLFIVFTLPIFLLPCAQSNQVPDKIDSLLAPDDTIPAYGAVIFIEGKLLGTKNYGYENLEKLIPANEYTLYHLSYLSTQFTAFSILKLAEERKIDLKDKVNTYLKNFPNYAEDVRIIDLLNHTSGLPNYFKELGFEMASRVTEQDVYHFLKQQDSLYFEAGTKYLNSFSDYAVLSFVIKEVSGLSYKNYIEETFFKPIGMNNSYVHSNGKPSFFQKLFKKTNPVTYTHSFINGKINVIERTESNFVLGQEGIFVTTNDYAKWEHALFHDSIISEDIYNKVFTRARLRPNEVVYKPFGYGWFNDMNNYMHTYHIFGADLYNTNAILRIPDMKATVLLLNKRNGVFGLRKTVFRVFNKFSRLNFVVK